LPTSNYLHKYNTDNVHARAVIVGLVNLLNSKVQYENIYSDTEIQSVTVPFYYNFGGDERFLQDYFLQWNECMTPDMVDGNIDPIPRGIVTLSSSTINTNMMANRFVRGNYVKQVGNEVITYNAFINPIPLSMNFDVKIVADTSLDAFKIQQSVLETFYKTQVFSVEFRGFRVPCQVGFPEDQGIEKTFEFTYQSDTEIAFNVPLQLETYFPVTDPTTERFGGNRMNYPGGPNIEWTSDEKYNLPRFEIISPRQGETYFSSGQMIFSWTNTGPITRVNLYYRRVGSPDWLPIVKNLKNSGTYTWNVPFLDSSGKEIKGETTRAFVNTQYGQGASLRAIIDSTGGVESVIILNGGYTYLGTDSIIVEDTSHPTIQPTISPKVVAGTIIGSQIYAVGADFEPTPVNQIEVMIEDANNDSFTQMLEQKVEFQAQTTNGSNILSNLIPNISTLEALNASGIYVGMPVVGAGIPANATVEQIISGSNQLQITTNANLSSPLTLISGGLIDGYITIK